MKILVVGSVYPRFAEDAEVPWLRHSLSELRNAGHEVQVLAPAYKGLKTHEIDGIKVNRFRYFTKSLEILTHDEGAPSKMAGKPWMQLLALPYIVNGFIQCLRICKKWKPDVIHAHWPFPHGLIVLGAAKVFRIPVVLNFHGAELLLIRKHKWVKHVLHFLLGQANAVFANSSFTASKIKAIKNCNVELSPYGTTLSGTSTGTLHPITDKFKILFVGRHIERKGLTYLIQAAKFLPSDKFEIRIVGQGDLTNSLQAEAANMPNIVFTGKLSPEALENEYKSANTFVLPAIVDSKGDTEGLGVVLIEAIEYDLPVVASNVGGIPDVIIDGKTGLLVNEKEPEALADAFKKLAGDQALASALNQGAQRHVRENFSWEPIVKKQIEIYKSLTK